MDSLFSFNKGLTIFLFFLLLQKSADPTEDITSTHKYAVVFWRMCVILNILFWAQCRSSYDVMACAAQEVRRDDLMVPSALQIYE